LVLRSGTNEPRDINETTDSTTLRLGTNIELRLDTLFVKAKWKSYEMHENQKMDDLLSFPMALSSAILDGRIIISAIIYKILSNVQPAFTNWVAFTTEENIISIADYSELNSRKK